MKALRWVAGCLVAAGVCLGQTSSQVSAVGGVSSSAAAVVADPALWQVKGAHGTVYLFGSLHVMRPGVAWETAKVKTALKASDTLYLEISNIDDVAAAQPMILQMGMDPVTPLSKKITKDDKALLDTAAKDIGMPGEAGFEGMQPWLVYVSLSVVPMMKAGYDPGSGVDHVLLIESKNEGRRIKGFETISTQLHMLADFSQADQVAMLHEELAELPKATAQMNQMVGDWERGDVEAIARLENGELAITSPALYQRLIVDRNRKWADTLEGLLKDEHTGTVFVVVGAAHLAGPDSVVKMLEKDGYTVARQ